MAEPIVSMIVAMAENGVIGKDGDLPWRLPADLAHFKRVTMGRPVIMGRKTWQSINRPLPGRTNIVLTRSAFELPESVRRVSSPEAALEAAAPADEVMIIGGSSVYEVFMPLASRLHVTIVHAAFDGDTFFPPWQRDAWTETSLEGREPDEKNPYRLSFHTYERRR